MNTPPITEAMAIQLLRALYRLDGPVGSIDSFVSQLPPGAAKEQLIQALGELMRITQAELMVPLFAAHPQLGTSSNPGSWLHTSS